VAAHPNATIAQTTGVEWLVYADDYGNADYRATILPALRRETAAGAYAIRCTSGRVHAYERAAPRRNLATRSGS
jgi:hypothetical protein